MATTRERLLRLLEEQPDALHVFTLEELGERFGVSRQRIAQILQRVGIQKERRYTRQFRKQVVRYAKRHGDTAAARTYKVSRFTVARWRRKLEQEG